MNRYAEIKTANTNSLEKYISYFIVVLCVILCVVPTAGLAQTQETSSKKETIERKNQVAEITHNSDQKQQENIGDKSKDDDEKLFIGSLSTLISLIIFPFVLWTLRSLVVYNFERFYTVQLLKVDIKSRMDSIKTALYYLNAWIDYVDKTKPPFPYLTIEREIHLVFPTVQDSVRKVLWFEEVWLIRNLYSFFDAVEIRAANIARLHASYLEKTMEEAVAINAIKANRDYIIRYRDAYENAWENNRGDISSEFFFSRSIYALLFFLPLCLLFLVIYVLLLTESPLSIESLLSIEFLLFIAFSIVVIIIWLVVGVNLCCKNEKMKAFSNKVEKLEKIKLKEKIDELSKLSSTL